MSVPTREVELKARVDDVDAARRNVEDAGATLVFDGQLSDRLYDSPARSLTSRDMVLRLRTYETAAGISAHIDWKGPTTRENGFKVREELTSGVTDPDAIVAVLARLGYEPIRAIDRHITQYELTGAGESGVVIVRFERYPRMDILVEVEGTPSGIERAIEILGIPRARFNAGRLTDFVVAYEARTGHRAAVCNADIGST